MLGAQPYYEPLTTQQIDEEKKKIKTLTDLKNDVLIDSVGVLEPGSAFLLFV